MNFGRSISSSAVKFGIITNNRSHLGYLKWQSLQRPINFIITTGKLSTSNVIPKMLAISLPQLSCTKSVALQEFVACHSIYRFADTTTDSGNFIVRWLKSFRRKTQYPTGTLRLGGLNLYEKCVDEINLQEFTKLCALSDTFFSWFLITELHVWMCMSRAMQEGHDGRVVRNVIVRLFWEDVMERIKLLGHIARSKKNEQVSTLESQFHAAMFIYDEGILSSQDTVLAGALWRRLLQAQGEDPIALERLVHYVRKQVKNLDECPRESFLLRGNFKWNSL